MAEQFDNEIEAIKQVIKTLEPLTREARASVLEYVHKRLAIAMPMSFEQSAVANVSGVIEAAAVAIPVIPGPPVHIKGLKEQKKPRSANEMAALVAYYLENLAAEKKRTVNTKNIETYFKIAQFPLPENIKMTLQNAKSAGYFDAVGDGEYKLNAVGHNLVVHSMPRGAVAESGGKKTRRAKTK